MRRLILVICLILISGPALAQQHFAPKTGDPYNTPQGTHVPEHARPSLPQTGKKPAGTMSAYTPPSCAQVCQRQHGECKASVAKDHRPGEFGAAIFATKMTTCNVALNGCMRSCR